MKTNEKEIEDMKEMIDFHFVRKEPNLLELKAYLHQILRDDEEFSINMRECINDDFPLLGSYMYRWDLNIIPEPYIRWILKEVDLLPEEILYFRKDYYPDAISDNNYKNFPEIFTRVGYVSFYKSAVLVLEVYSSHRYMLFDENGKNLSECRYTLQFGTDGKLRLGMSGSVLWEVMLYNGEYFKDSGFISGSFNSPSYFPALQSRVTYRYKANKNNLYA
jgi:hypothetical protein